MATLAIFCKACNKRMACIAADHYMMLYHCSCDLVVEFGITCHPRKYRQHVRVCLDTVDGLAPVRVVGSN